MKRQHVPSLLKSYNREEKFPFSKSDLSRRAFVDNWITMHPLAKCSKADNQNNGKNLELTNHLDFAKSVIYKDHPLCLEISDDSKLANMLNLTLAMNCDETKMEESDEESKSEWETKSVALKGKTYSLIDYQADTVKFGATFKEFPVAEFIKIGDTISIFMVEFVAPFRFWFQIKNSHKTFNQLMRNMNYEYTALSEDKLVMASGHVFPQQICTLYTGINWVRGVIKSYLMGSTVKVFLVDFGITLEISPKKLKYLKAKYMEMPRQAIRGTLANVIPKDDTYLSKRATNFLSEITCKKCFNCNVEKIKRFGEKNDCHLEVFKCDSGENICKLLVDKGFANYKRE